MIEIEEICSPEWAEWYRMTPAERWMESAKLWNHYISIGGSLDPEPDTQSPFFDPELQSEVASDGRSGMRVIRRSGV